MVNPEARLFCHLDGLTTAAREQKRLKALEELGLGLEAQTIPVFEEATQTAARFMDIDAPICILSLMGHDREWIKSAVNLSRLGLMNVIAASRQIPRNASFGAYVVDSHQVLVIGDTHADPLFAGSILTQQYGIRAYLGIPLRTASGICLGVLAVMDLEPRIFTPKDIEFLELTARWSISEYERNRLFTEANTTSSAQPTDPVYWFPKSPLSGQVWGADLTNGNTDSLLSLTHSSSTSPSAQSIKVKLLTQLSQELRTPLTSVMGMASVLTRELYGPLTSKQKEYLQIIYNSGQYLVSLVDEILALGDLEEGDQKLDLTPVDIEMLCQQAINSLQQVAHQRQQQVRLWVDPNNRLWLLDKDKVRQMLYYLLFSVIHSADAGSIVSIHVSRKNDKLNIVVSVSHPWLGDGLHQVEVYSHLSSVSTLANGSEIVPDSNHLLEEDPSSVSSIQPSYESSLSHSTPRSVSLGEGWNLLSSLNNGSREGLGLILSCQLADIHGGQISVQGSPESGYRYVIILPQLTAVDENF